MTSELGQYIEAGRALDADEREVAALALQRVDESEQAAVDHAWSDEVDRRVDEILAGEVHLVDGEETLAMARAKLAAHRST